MEERFKSNRGFRWYFCYIRSLLFPCVLASIKWIWSENHKLIDAFAKPLSKTFTGFDFNRLWRSCLREAKQKRKRDKVSWFITQTAAWKGSWFRSFMGVEEEVKSSYERLWSWVFENVGIFLNIRTILDTLISIL